MPTPRYPDASLICFVLMKTAPSCAKVANQAKLKVKLSLSACSVTETIITVNGDFEGEKLGWHRNSNQ